MRIGPLLEKNKVNRSSLLKSRGSETGVHTNRISSVDENSLSEKMQLITPIPLVGIPSLNKNLQNSLRYRDNSYDDFIQHRPHSFEPENQNRNSVDSEGRRRRSDSNRILQTNKRASKYFNQKVNQRKEE